jgi:hypothetical protein
MKIIVSQIVITLVRVGETDCYPEVDYLIVIVHRAHNSFCRDRPITLQTTYFFSVGAITSRQVKAMEINLPFKLHLRFDFQ